MPAGGRWIEPFAVPASPRLRVLCFPCAGGSADHYRSWAALAPAGVQVTVIRRPVGDSHVDEAPPRSAQEVAQGVGPALARCRDEVPWVFFGHSLGAWLAYETAHWLMRNGFGGPRGLVVASASAPHLPHSSPPSAHLPDAEFLAHLNELGGLPDVLVRHPRLARLWLPRLRADMHIYDTYRHLGPIELPCPIAALAGTDDRLAPVADVAQWRRHTAGQWSLEVRPGDHFSVLTDPAPALAALTKKWATP
ncbi:thioesterase II family protein [Streptomyces albospinus]|nr:thioesterase domain-containing protein [Streptomyces albospinus]